MKLLKNKKFKGMALNDMPTAALFIVVIAMALGAGALILEEYQNVTWSLHNGTSDAYNIQGKGLDALSTFGDWLTIIVIVVIAALVIGLLVGYFMRRTSI